MSYEEESKLYSVRYPDGDQEDLDQGELESCLETGIIPGYIGKSKGMQQYLWERGLYFETKINPTCTHTACQKKGKGCPMLTAVNPKKVDPHNRDLTYCMKTVLGNCRCPPPPLPLITPFGASCRSGNLSRTIFCFHAQRFRHGAVGAGAEVY